MSSIKVLVVDDSALMRQLLSEILSSAPDIEVVGQASDPYRAREKILELEPDVLTLDVEMPRMDGLTFLDKLMRGRPMPVVMVSSLTEKGCATTIQALELGAVDFITKPRIDLSDGMVEIGAEILEKVRRAARARVTRRVTKPTPQLPAHAATADALATSTHKIIAIGASTGGTQALSEMIPQMPADSPGIVTVLHMPASFTKAFADRLNETSQMEVREAADGDTVLPGKVLIAPGDFHMTVTRSGARYKVAINHDAPVNQFRPSVDVLFHSCARYVASNAVGVILTGMGNDGAEGLLAMRRAGAATFAQNEETCVVFGMPKQAIQLGAAEHIVSLDKMASSVLTECKKRMVPVAT